MPIKPTTIATYDFSSLQRNRQSTARAREDNDEGDDEDGGDNDVVNDVVDDDSDDDDDNDDNDDNASVHGHDQRHESAIVGMDGVAAIGVDLLIVGLIHQFMTAKIIVALYLAMGRLYQY